MQTKKWYQSKTVWLAVVQAVAGVLAAIAVQDPTLGWVIGAKSALDILVRVLGTAQPIQ